MALQGKRAAFVKEYPIDLNATQAARRAGYSAKTARAIGQRLLTNVAIADAIAAGQAQRFARLDIRADCVLQEVARLAFVDIRTFFDAQGTLKPIAEWDADAAAAVASIEVVETWSGQGEQRVCIGQTKKLRLWNKVENLALLGKHLKLFLRPGKS
jgi:phage terminase small subunit